MNTFTVLCEDPSTDPRMASMAKITGTWFDHQGGPPENQALIANRQLAQVMPGARCLNCAYALKPTLDSAALDPINLMLPSYPLAAQDLKYSRTISRLRVPVDLAYFDLEYLPFSYWEIGGPLVISICRMPEVVQTAGSCRPFLDAIAGLSRLDHLDPAQRFNIINWEIFVWHKRQATFYAFLAAIGLTQPLKVQAFTTDWAGATDSNGWPLPSGAFNQKVLNDQCYFKIPGLASRYSKHPQWNALIHHVNFGVMNHRPLKGRYCIPDICSPGFAGCPTGWLLGRLLAHWGQMGMDRVCFFNPAEDPLSSSPDQQAMVADAAAAAEIVYPEAEWTRPLQPIPFDAEQITTGGITTTYAEFVNLGGLGGLDPVGKAVG